MQAHCHSGQSQSVTLTPSGNASSIGDSVVAQEDKLETKTDWEDDNDIAS